MKTEMDFSSIVTKIGENVPAIKRNNENQNTIALKEKMRTDPIEIRKRRMSQLSSELREKQDQIFIESNVVEIFNQLRDQGILYLSNEPVYKENVVNIKMSFIEKLFSSGERKIIKTKISEHKPAEVSILLDKNCAYFYENDKLVHWKISTVHDHFLRVFIGTKNVSIKFNEDTHCISRVTAVVEGGFLKIEGKKTHTVDESLDLITAIEMAIADPYIESKDRGSVDGGSYDDGLDRQAPAIRVRFD